MICKSSLNQLLMKMMMKYWKWIKVIQKGTGLLLVQIAVYVFRNHHHHLVHQVNIVFLGNNSNIFELLLLALIF